MEHTDSPISVRIIEDKNSYNILFNTNNIALI